MENNWYTSHEEAQAQGASWYAPASAPAAAVPAAPKKRRWLKIVSLTLALVALIAASCYVFREQPGESGSFSFRWPSFGSGSGSTGESSALPDLPFSFGGGDSDAGQDGYHDNFQDFFDNYYTSFSQAEACTIPTVKAGAGLTITLAPADSEELTLQQIYERCAPSIVAITAYTQEGNDGAYAWGTGVIFSADGYIVTNSHIVEGTCRAKVTLHDDREFDALLVGNDARSDIAVLKIDATGLTAAEFATSEGLQVGDPVAAIGNPLGDSFRCTLTDGIISGIDRDISYNGTTLTLIQTNAALNEGNSGGALVNLYGQVIGITNMKMSNSYGSVTIEGVGFAIPSVTMKAMADALLSDGAVTGRPALGVTVGAIPAEAAEHYALPEGLYVSVVADGSDCAAKGLRKGDVITHVNGQPARATSDITSLIAGMAVGDTLPLTVYRTPDNGGAGESFEITVALVDSNDVY